MKSRLDDIRFVNLCARNEFKRELGRTLTRPEVKPVKLKESAKPNTLWTTRFTSSDDKPKQ